MEAKTWMRIVAGLVIGIGAMLAAVYTLVPGTALAGRPPPPPPPPTEGGVIYYLTWNGTGAWAVWAMAPSGADKALVLAAVPGWAEPSKSLHNEKRWFLVELPVEGTYPDGLGRREAFALSDAGDSVQLTDDPSLQTGLASWSDADDCPGLRWTQNDATVTFVARRWGTDGNGADAIVETGLYAVDLGNGGVADPGLLPAVPRRIPIDLPTYTVTEEYPPYPNGLFANVYGFDWAPDGRSFVYCRVNTENQDPGVYVTSLDTGLTLRLVDHPGVSRWSPPLPNGGTTILITYGDVEAISPDGTNQRVLVAPVTTRKTREWPVYGFWSPSGASIGYQWITRSAKAPYYFLSVDLYRATSEGTDRTNLTADIANSVIPIGWRATP